MKWKTTLLLLAATVGVGAYVSLYELKQPTEQQRQRRSQYILNLKPETVTQIVLNLPQVKTTLTRQEALWVLGPDHLRADGNRINQLLIQAWPLSAERNLSSSKQLLEPKTFGLDPALGSVAFTADGSTTTLLIGEPTPVGSSRYVKLTSRPDIFIISARFFSALDKPVEFFRDHALGRINPQLCQDIELKSGGIAWHAAKEKDVWQVKTPYSDKADPVEIAGVLTELGQMGISKFIQDAPDAAQLSLYGLDHPKTTLTVQMGEPPVTTVFSFGKPLPDNGGLIFARRSDEQPVYAVSAEAVKRLLKEAAALRSKPEQLTQPPLADKPGSPEHPLDDGGVNQN